MREHWESGYEDTKRTLKHKKNGLKCRRRVPGSSCTMSIVKKIPKAAV
jgi:hypothetical protein